MNTLDAIVCLCALAGFGLHWRYQTRKLTERFMLLIMHRLSRGEHSIDHLRERVLCLAHCHNSNIEALVAFDRAVAHLTKKGEIEPESSFTPCSMVENDTRDANHHQRDDCVQLPHNICGDMLELQVFNAILDNPDRQAVINQLSNHNLQLVAFTLETMEAEGHLFLNAGHYHLTPCGQREHRLLQARALVCFRPDVVT